MPSLHFAAFALLLLLARPAAAQSCAPTDAVGAWSGAQPGVPGVGCSSCSGSSASTFTLACPAGYVVSGSATGTCTYSKACGKNTFLGLCTSCQSCGYSAAFTGGGSCVACTPGSCTSCTPGNFLDATKTCRPCA